MLLRLPHYNCCLVQRDSMQALGTDRDLPSKLGVQFANGASDEAHMPATAPQLHYQSREATIYSSPCPPTCLPAHHGCPFWMHRVGAPKTTFMQHSAGHDYPPG